VQSVVPKASRRKFENLEPAVRIQESEVLELHRVQANASANTSANATANASANGWQL
jgi:hypothetical protein